MGKVKCMRENRKWGLKKWLRSLLAASPRVSRKILLSGLKIKWLMYSSDWSWMILVSIALKKFRILIHSNSRLHSIELKFSGKFGNIFLLIFLMVLGGYAFSSLRGASCLKKHGPKWVNLKKMGLTRDYLQSMTSEIMKIILIDIWNKLWQK